MKLSRHTIHFAIGMILCAFVLNFSPSKAEAGTSVFVSILPQKYFVGKIGGDLVDVSVMVMPGASPATYEPTPRQMAQLSRAKGYFSIGAPFEATWLPRISSANDSMPVIKTDKGITKIPMQTHHHEDMHDDHAQKNGIPDPHIWLAPDLVQTVAQNTCDGLIQIDPLNADTYQANLAAFMRELAELDANIRQHLESLPKEKRSFMVFHPSWGYFAKQYNLKQIPIESEGKSPSPKDLAEIIEHGRELGITVVFVQPQFSKKSAQVIASEIGAHVLPLNPLAEDWANNLHHATSAFGQALK